MAAQIHLSQQHSCSFDQLVSSCEQFRRNFEAERFGGLEIEHEFKFGRDLHRHLPRLCAFEDAINIGGRATKIIGGNDAV